MSTARSLAATHQPLRRNQNTARFSASVSLGPITNIVMIVLMVTVLGLLYLGQISKKSSYGYEMNDIQANIAELDAKKRDLEIENARLQALERVKNSGVTASLASPSKTDYAQN